MSHILLQQVLEFHKKYKKTIGDPRFPNVHAEKDFRLSLIDEEYTELKDALADPNLTERERVIQVADALGDMAYVIFGAAICWGIDLATVLDAIHVSNMTKSLGEKREDGKVLKGPDYQPPAIAQALTLAAHDFQEQMSNETPEDECWWPEPSSIQGEDSFLPESMLEEVDPAEEITNKIMLKAKDQAKILAMKSITEDFVPDTKSNGLTQDGRPYTVNSSPAIETTIDELAKSLEAETITGQMTAYGAYVFDCPCGRKHAVQAKLGSRGGLADKGKAECMCGAAFVVDFSTGSPKVTVTTIEEMRKADV